MMMLMLRRRKRMMLRRMMLRRKTDFVPACAVEMHGPFTRAMLCGNSQGKRVNAGP